MERFSRRVGELATLMPLTRRHGPEDVAFDRVAADAEGVRRHGLDLDMINGRFGALSWIVMQLLAVLCLIVASALAVLQWMPITAGQVVLLGTYFTTLTGTVMPVLSFMPLVARGREAVRSLAEVFEDPDIEQNEGNLRVERVVGRFELRGVRVHYTDGDRHALDGVDLVIPAGQTIAFVGTSGSGKSTLVNSVFGFVRPTEGTILIDGVDMATLDLRHVRRSISVVPQDSVLFEGTIRENVSYGLTHVDESSLRAALQEANAWEMVQALPDGWDTVVGERGARLSGGQRQRISIARALIRDPRCADPRRGDERSRLRV